MKLIIEERTKRITLICCMVLIVGTIGGTILGYPPMKQSLLEQGVSFYLFFFFFFEK